MQLYKTEVLVGPGLLVAFGTISNLSSVDFREFKSSPWLPITCSHIAGRRRGINLGTVAEMAMIKIDADFNEVDYKGRIILINVDEHKSEQIELKEGMHVILRDEEGEVEAILEFEASSSGTLSDFLGRKDKKGSWRARILPGTSRRS